MKAEHVRIASYNLQKCVGLDLRRRPDRSLEVIGALQAQIVVLQEADKRLPPRPAALPHEMAEDEGWHVAHFGEPGGSLGWHGNAMLLAPGIDILKTDHIDLPGLEPRGAILAELATPIGPLRVLGVHLGLIRRYRLLQLAAITRHLRRLPPLPTVLAGDFNEWGPARALDVATPGLTILPERPSFPSPRPVAPLDRFALSPDLRALAHGTHSARPARVASDHLPVWADLARQR
ncbi:endonuclease/exonuclease/phosphatase family protein [Marimonas arenosa]|uniref:Endonuclease/exonuclease/phosphatase family protein n=1 Tax=Marimonas arenosa TaxID=1795305 RepID=A0AAE3WF87_9RHOB|nr:endonuclease/exonuclease/phosphatase family protein [Marimonas arenosa]MDQ2091290.1 endonuclease/exonuclease/phosphatase family protein [Marimonas arenosa]